MANIILHQVGSVTVGLDKKDGYVNATALCAAFNAQKGAAKKVNGWTRSASAKEYIAYVSAVTQNCATDLVVVKQGGDPGEQGTWIHPDLADSFAAWLSVEYQYAVSKWLQDWRSGKAETRFPDSTIGKVETDPVIEGVAHISAAIDCIFATIGMKPQLVAGIKTEAIAANYPQYRPALEAAKSSLTLALPSSLVTPTKLAELWNARTGESLTARSMNKLLEDRKLQRKTGQENPSWEAIGLGVEHGEVTANTAKGHAKTVQALRWHKSVLDLLG